MKKKVLFITFALIVTMQQNDVIINACMDPNCGKW